jgi:lipid A disaccharide synthetase
VKTSAFAMPNLLMEKLVVPEFIGLRSKKMLPNILKALESQDPTSSRQLSVNLTERLGKGFIPDYFVDKLVSG